MCSGTLMQLRSFALLVILLLCATVACSEGGTAGQTAQAVTPAVAAPAPAGPCRLTLGWDPAEPFQYRSAEGALAGLDIELVQAVAAAAHCELDFAEGRWVTLVLRLQRGDVDVLAGAMRTPARETYALFSEPYRNESIALY